MTKIIKIKDVATPKAFSSHPGHGDAAKTLKQYETAADQTRQFFPADAQETRLDHSASKNH